MTHLISNRVHMTRKQAAQACDRVSQNGAYRLRRGLEMGYGMPEERALLLLSLAVWKQDTLCL